MKNKIVVYVLCLLLVMVGAIQGCADKEVNWTFQSGQVSSNIYFMQEFEDCVKRIADRTDGKFNISIAYAGELGIKTVDFPYAVGRGDVEISVIGSGEMEGIWHGLHVLQLPFFVRNQDDVIKAWNATKSNFVPSWGEMGFQMISPDTLFVFGPQELITSKPIPDMMNLEGLRIRIWRTGDAELIKALGAEPIQMSFSEVYMALQRGAVDGIVTSAAGMVETSLYEPGEHFYRVGFAPGSQWAVVNVEAFEALPDEYKTILVEEFEASCTANRDMYWTDIENSSEKLRSFGVTVNELPQPVVDTWVKAALPIWEAWGIEESGNQEILDAAMKALGL